MCLFPQSDMNLPDQIFNVDFKKYFIHLLKMFSPRLTTCLAIKMIFIC